MLLLSNCAMASIAALESFPVICTIVPGKIVKCIGLAL